MNYHVQFKILHAMRRVEGEKMPTCVARYHVNNITYINQTRDRDDDDDDDGVYY